jgi:hypothetical protein
MNWIICRGLAELARLCLFFWLVMAPLFWIARDGVAGGETVAPSSAGLTALCRFLAVWGVPAAVLLAARLGLRRAARRAATAAGDPFDEEAYRTSDDT